VAKAARGLKAVVTCRGTPADLTRPAALPMMGAQADSHPPVLAQWHQAAGDDARALSTLRRRVRVSNAYYYLLEPRYLREEGRLATIVGDTAGATQALRHYLVLRDRPDPGPMSDDVRWARTRLSELNR